MLLKSVFIGFLSFHSVDTPMLKECENHADKISGCAERQYYQNGNIWVETPYKNGKVEGIAKWYYQNGNLKEEIPYKNDKTEGIEKQYFENGNLESETPYKNGKREGIEKWYHYENGKLRAEIPFKNDSVNGDIKLYTKDGKLLALIKAENNKFISGKCSSDKALTSKDLEESNKYPYFESAINHLEVICLKSDSK